MSLPNQNQPGGRRLNRSSAELDSAVARPPRRARATCSNSDTRCLPSRVSTFAPVANVPVSDYYVNRSRRPAQDADVGTNQQQSESDGRGATASVSIPEIGPLAGRGVETSRRPRSSSKITPDKSPASKVDVTMGKLKNYPGVRRRRSSAAPARITVSALSHVSNALGAAGGITKDRQSAQGGAAPRAISLCA